MQLKRKVITLHCSFKIVPWKRNEMKMTLWQQNNVALYYSILVHVKYGSKIMAPRQKNIVEKKKKE